MGLAPPVMFLDAASACSAASVAATVTTAESASSRGTVRRIMMVGTSVSSRLNLANTFGFARLWGPVTKMVEVPTCSTGASAPRFPPVKPPLPLRCSVLRAPHFVVRALGLLC